MKFFDNDDTSILEALRTSGAQSLEKLAVTLKLNKSTLHYRLKELLAAELITKETLSKKNVVYRLAPPDLRRTYTEKLQQYLNTVLFGETKKLSTAKKPLLVFSDRYLPTSHFFEQITQKYEVVSYPESAPFLEPETFLYRCQEAEVIVTFASLQITREMLLQLPKLRHLVTASISQSLIDKTACQDLGISVHSLPRDDSYKKPARREFVFAALFALFRPLYLASQDLKLGNFDYSAFPAQEINGKTVGLVGGESEVSWVAPILRALGAEVLIAPAKSSHGTPTEFGLSHFSSLETLFTKADIIIFPEEYEQAININAFLSSTMKTEYFLFMTHQVTYDVLKLRKLILQRHVKGIVIDYFPDLFNVFSTFPKSVYRHLYNLPQVLITPEIGFFTQEAMVRNYTQLTEILLSLISKEKK